MSIESVISIMREQIDLHDSLLTLGHQKKAVLINNEVALLNQIVLKESKLIKQIEALEKQRMMEISSFLLSRGFNPNPKITITDLIRVVFKAEDKVKLQEHQRELFGKIQELQKVNELNQQMIRQSLSFIDYSLNVLVGDQGDELLYSNPMHQQSQLKRNGYFDTKA
ncbi:flagellar protein FlgN [Paenibacillus hexagrammi]|uniref:Flagellar protein FlgN n=1 Tax=Paenibacillus hexagrammi TaxID=2908839 RepID=A0ABY3SI92_9BACL|nr:flagellar protein FlgN [Paenibacillus sp. YPD9-1]UJF33230.1 flagellar protein FlgN [Paenibacillus sp. YPD9-1]